MIEEVENPFAANQNQILIDEKLLVLRTILNNLEMMLRSFDFEALSTDSDFFELCEHLHKLHLEFDDQLPEEIHNNYRDQLATYFAASSVFNSLWEFLYFCIVEQQLNDKFVKSTKKDGSIDLHSSINVVCLLLQCMDIFSDFSIYFCLALSKCDHFLSTYKIVLNGWFQQHESKDGLVQPVNLIPKKLMECAYNCYYKGDSAVGKQLDSFDFLTSANLYLRSNDSTLKFTALLLVIFIVDEGQADFYHTEKDNIQFLVSLFEEAISNKNRRCKDGYHVIQLASAIDRLAKNDCNKEVLVDLGVFKVLKKMLTGTHEDEIFSALDLLFTLSFNEKIQLLMKEQFTDIIMTLDKDDRFNKTEDYKGLKFLVFANNTKELKTILDKDTISKKPNADHGHIMLSYQHDDKELVKRIKDELVMKHGMNVWIDYEQMVTGSTIEAMADAVENASIVLLCMSRKYKESNNCRLEGEYAFNKGKVIFPLRMQSKYRPDGWLGLILGSKLYYDFSGKYPFEVKIVELAKAIGSELNIVIKASEEVIIPQKNKKQSSSTSKDVVDKTLARYTEIRKWKHEEYINWCESKKLPEYVKQLNIDGEQLYCILNAKNRAPEAFYWMAKDCCGKNADFRTISSFINALDDM